MILKMFETCWLRYLMSFSPSSTYLRLRLVYLLCVRGMFLLFILTVLLFSLTIVIKIWIVSISRIILESSDSRLLIIIIVIIVGICTKHVPNIIIVHKSGMFSCRLWRLNRVVNITTVNGMWIYEFIATTCKICMITIIIII